MMKSKQNNIWWQFHGFSEYNKILSKCYWFKFLEPLEQNIFKIIAKNASKYVSIKHHAIIHIYPTGAHCVIIT